MLCFRDKGYVYLLKFINKWFHDRLDQMHFIKIFPKNGFSAGRILY